MDEAIVSESAKSSKPPHPDWLIEARKRASTSRERIFGTPGSTSSTSTVVIEAGPEPSALTTGVPAIPTESTTILPASLQGGLGKKRFQPLGKDSLLKTYRQKIEDRRMLRARSFPFISDHFHPDFRLCQGLIVVGALTGQSKSTTNANVLAAFLDFRPNHRAIAITNEESMDSVYNRVACIRLGLNFNRYHTGLLPEASCRRVEEEAEKLVDRIEVVCSGQWDMTYLEDAQAVLDYAGENPESVGLVTVDYFQTVVSSRLNRMMTPYEVHKRFGLYLKNYGTRLGAPVIAFAQLSENAGETTSFKSRIEGDKHLLNHAFDGIEIIPDFKALKTKFIIHKSRFGIPKGTEIEADYKDGRLIFASEEQKF